MKDFKPQVVEALNKILPTYYELFLGKDIELPCITYSVGNDETIIHTEEAGITDVRFTIKLWGYSISELSQYAIQVDEAMRAMRFRRNNYNELSTDNQICLIFNYVGTAFEKY